MASPPRSGAIAIPFLLAGLICGLFAFALFSCGGGGAGSIELGNWSAAISLDNSSAGQFVPDVAVDGNGNAIAVWFQSDGSGTFNVWAALYRDGTGWDPPSLIGNDNAIVADNPRVAVDGNGNALAVWEQLDVIDLFITRTVWANRYTRGGCGPTDTMRERAGRILRPSKSPWGWLWAHRKWR